MLGLLYNSIRLLGLNQQQIIDNIKMEHSQEMSVLRQKLEQDARQLEIKFQNRMEAQRNELEKRRYDRLESSILFFFDSIILYRKSDLQEIDSNDQQHVTVLRANHDHAIIDLKNYFNDIILNNMTLISSMKVISFKKI